MINIILVCVAIAIGAFILICNLIVAKTMTTAEMKEEFITGQCTVGVVAAQIFYSIAWLLKGIKKFFNLVVK